MTVRLWRRREYACAAQILPWLAWSRDLVLRQHMSPDRGGRGCAGRRRFYGCEYPFRVVSRSLAADETRMMFYSGRRPLKRSEMENALIWVALAVVLSLAFLLRVRSARRDQERSTKARSRRGGAFHAVEIRSEGDPCSAARTVAGKRFLSSEAPNVPLPACSQEVCSCVYVHFEDRRARQRRDAYLHRAYADGERKQERRVRVGRRMSDRTMLDA